MSNSRLHAAISGFLFILAGITSIIGFEDEPGAIMSALFETILAVSVIGTAIMLFPYFKKKNEGLAIVYVCFRILEAIFVIIGTISILALLGPTFMLGLNTVICSYLLYKSLLVPRFISAMGLTGSIFIFYAAVLEMFGIIEQVSYWGIILSIPLLSYEMTLAFWLLFKGFNASAFHSRKIILQT
jgi:hypothetical protein